MVWSQRLPHMLPLPHHTCAQAVVGHSATSSGKELGQISIAPHIHRLPPDAGDTLRQTSAAVQPGDAD